MSRVARDVNAPRVCTDCGEKKPAGDFRVREYNDDRSPRTRQSYCAVCARKRSRRRRSRSRSSKENRRVREKQTRAEINRKNRERYHRYRTDPDWVERKRAKDRARARDRRELAKQDEALAEAIRATNQRWRDRVRADPERYLAYLSAMRIRDRTRRNSTRVFSNALGGYQEACELVPAAPFLRWLDTAFPDETPETIEARIGLNAKIVRNMRDGQGTVSLGIVDTTLTVGLGRPDLVATLYPVE